MSTNISSTEQIVEINAGDQITNVNIVSQSTTQVISGEQVVTVDVNAGTIPAAWGSITGTLSNQTDLQNALNAKQNNITLTTTGTSGAATLVGATLNIPNYTDTGLTSVGLAMPTGFDVSGSPLTSNGTLNVNFASGYSLPTTTKQGQWDQAYNDKINSAEVSGTTTKTLTLTQQDGGIIQASWSDIDTAPVTSVFGRTGDVVAAEGDYNLNQLGDVTITTATNGQVLKYNGTAWVNAADASGLTSVGVSMPSAFNVSGSPLTSNGTIAITGAGTTSQYIRGDGSLATFPSVASEAKTLIREVYNSTGATLAKGTVVYINGGQGNLPTVTKALAVGDTTSAQTFGIVQSDITNMNNGFVVVAGGIDNLDTQAYSVGTALYLSPTTAGAITTTKPYAPDHLVYLGVVVRSHPTQGVIEVKIQNGYELDELHNVSARFPSNKDGLFYNTANSVWENKSIEGVLGYTPVPNSRVITINGTAQDLTADRTYNVGTVTSVNATVPTGFEVSGVPITSTGTIDIKFASGYSLPTDAKQTQWDTAYTKRIDSLTVTGNSGSSTLVSNILNIPTYTLSGLGGEPAITAGTTLQYFRGDKTFQTLDTSVVPENGPVYFTEPRVRQTVLSGLNVTGGSIVATDNVLNAFGKIQNQINGLIGGSIFQSTWNASTNVPTLTSSVGTKGYYYIVSTAGSTNLDGITDWQIGDWAIFDGTVWRKVDNTDAVVSVNGFTGIVNLALDNISDVSATSPTGGQLLRFNGTSSVWENWTPTYISAAITSLNGLTGAVQTMVTGTAGTDFTIDASGSVHTFNIPTASATKRGLLSSADWSTFNGKQDALTNPVTGTGTNNQLAYFNSTGSTISSLSTSTYPSLTELSYVKGVTSSIQTQLDSKQPTLTNPVTGTGTAGQVAYWSSSSAITSESALFWDATNNRLGIGNDVPTAQLYLRSGGTYTNTDQNNRLVIERSTDAYILFTTADDYDQGIHFHNTTDNEFVGRISYQHRATGDKLLFNVGASTNNTLVLTSTQRAGIGTLTPNYNLHVVSGNAATEIVADNSATGGAARLRLINAERSFLLTNNAGDDLLSFSYAAANRLQFSTTDQWFNEGKLGIGTVTPADNIHISASEENNVGLAIQNTNASYSAQVRFLNSTGVEKAAMTYVQSDGSLVFGVNSVNLLYYTSNSKVGILESDPYSTFQVAGSIGATGARVSSAPTVQGIFLGMSTATDAAVRYACLEMVGGADGGSEIDFTVKSSDYKGRIGYENSTNVMRFETNAASRVTIGATGTVAMSAYTTNGFVKFSGGDGTLAVDTTTYLSGSGTAGRIPKYTAANTLGNSLFIESGNFIGLNTTPFAWLSTWTSVMDLTNGAIAGPGDANFILAANCFYNNSPAQWRYKTTAVATRIEMNEATGMAFYTAPSGTANTAITFKETLRLDENGTVKIAQYTSNGFVKTSSSNGTLIIDTTTYLSGSGTSGYIPKYTAANTLGNSLIYDDGSKVAIGTTTVGSFLFTVNGSMTLNGPSVGNTDIQIKNPTNTKTHYIFSDANSNELGIESGTGSGIKLNTNGANTRLAVASNGAATFTSSVTAGDPNVEMTSSGTTTVLKLTNTNTGGSGVARIILSNAERNFILTNNAGDDLLSFSYGNANRLQFDTTNQWFPEGRLGIGTITPQTNLQISSSTGQTDTFGYVQAVYTGTVANQNAGYTAKNYNGTSQFMQWETYGLRIGSRILTNSGVGDLYFTAGADDVKMFIGASGSIGMGTTSPADNLHVSGSEVGNVGISIQNRNASYSAQVRFLNSANAEKAAMTYVQSTGSMVFGVNGVNLVEFTSGSKVGINRSDPYSTLDVAGSIGATGARVSSAPTRQGVYLGNSGTTSGDYATIEMCGGTSGGCEIDFTVPSEDWRGRIGYNNGSNYMWFSTNSSGEVMRLTSAQEILMGYTTDQGSYKLQVNGSILASSFFESSDLRLKDVLNSINSSNFSAIEFNWKDKRDEKKHWGYAAQDVLKFIPDAVQTNEDGMMTVNYNEAHTWKIAQLEQEIKELKSKLYEHKL